MNNMRVRGERKIQVILALFLLVGIRSYAQNNGQEQPYLCELGIQGGVGYYVGDATPHIFMNPREAYGIHFRYKFDKRWAIQAKVAGQHITGNEYDLKGNKLSSYWNTQLFNADVMAEFNFFRFASSNEYDKRDHPYTPYIFIGVGASVYTPDWFSSKIAASGYIPLGIGFKWRFHERLGLNIAWQHNIYFADDLESTSELNNKHSLNGWNWMNCDLTGMITVGLVVEFAPAKKPCRTCY